MTSASHHLAICCSSTVLPVPNPPGTAVVPPRVTGNSASITRCPVTSGASLSQALAAGPRTAAPARRDVRRTGAPPTVAITASSGTGPPGRSPATGPAQAGRHQHPVADPRPDVGHRAQPRSPPADDRVRPALTGVNLNSRLGSCAAATLPGSSQTGAPASGRSSPSNTPPSRRGPSSADSGSPRDQPGARAPGRRCSRRPGPWSRPPGSPPPRRAACPRRARRHRTSRRRRSPVTSTSGPFTRAIRATCAVRGDAFGHGVHRPCISAPSASTARSASRVSEQSTVTPGARASQPPAGIAVTTAPGPAARLASAAIRLARWS